MTDLPDRIEVRLTEHRGDQQTEATVEGPPVAVAAYLRATANLYDPPRPALRGTASLHTAYGPGRRYDGPAGSTQVGFGLTEEQQ